MRRLILSAILASFMLSNAIMFTGCGVVLVGGGAAGGYWYAKNYRKCPYCKKQVRKDATVCPNCQRPLKPIPEKEK